MSKPDRIVRCAPWSALFLLFASVSMAAAPSKPNVIIFLADDLGWSDVGYHGEEVIETPSIDRLAREGVELDRFYSTPICSPTRAALMTGRDPMRLGVAYGVIMPWMTNGVHPSEFTLLVQYVRGPSGACVGEYGNAPMSATDPSGSLGPVGSPASMQGDPG